MDAYTGEIRAFGFGYVPNGWALCDGSRVSLQQYQALYSLIGSKYGPTDNRTYFTLPNLLGQAPICTGVTNAPSGVPSTLTRGWQLGAATVNLTISQVPNHSHQVNGATAPSSSAMVPTPASNSLLSRAVSGNMVYFSLQNQDSPDTAMSGAMIQSTGGSQAHNNMQPYLALRFCICLDGYYPVPQ